MGDVGYIGHVVCDNCSNDNYTKYVYINNPDQLIIWYHPDDPRPLAQVTCPKCKSEVQSRIDYDDFVNFRTRGCKVTDFNDKFEPLTEEEIEGWDIESEFLAYF